MIRFGWSLLWLVAGTTAAARAQAPGPEAFIAWARKTAHRIETPEPGHGFSDLTALHALVGNAAVPANSTSLGMFLNAMSGNDYRNIGFAYNKGAMWGAPGARIDLPPAETGSIDWAMAQVGLPLFFVDFGTIPRSGAVREWLDRPVKQRIQNFSTEYNEFLSWDGLVFVDTVTPSRLAEKPVADEPKD